MIYRTIQGDSFDLIARKTLGDEGLMGAIIQANPEYRDYVLFPAGVELNIPPAPEPSSVINMPPWIGGA